MGKQYSNTAITIGHGLRQYQQPIWQYMMQEKPGLRGVTVWPRRNGKDWTAINVMAAKALQRVGSYAYIAPFAKQTRSIIWEGADGSGKRFIDYVPPELVTRKLDQAMKLWLQNGSTIQLFGSDNPDALVGNNFVGIIFTEYSLHKDVVWGYLRPMLAENGGWALFNGTPRGMNHFYQLAKMAKTNPDWFYERLTCEDTGFPSLEDIEAERLAGMPESLIEQEFYTSWSSSSEETLIPLDYIEMCVNHELKPEQYESAPRVLGVDPAFAPKGDAAAIARRQGRKVFPMEKHQGMDPMALATRVATIIREWKPHYVFVDAGRGEAVWSRLHQLGYQDRVIPVNFDGTTYDSLAHRKKDEIWGRLKAMICHPDPLMRMDLPKEEDLIRDLSAPTFEINERGKMVIESKKSLKSRGYSSTDDGDALALTCSEELEEVEVVTPDMERLGVTQEMFEQLQNAGDNLEYDPLNYMDTYAGTDDSFF